MTFKRSLALLATLLVPLAATLSVGCATRSTARAPVAASLPLALAQIEHAPVQETTASQATTPLDAPLDAARAVRIALLNNRELRAQLRDLGIARGRLMQAGLVANPVVEFEVLPERDTAYEVSVEYEITSLVLAPLRAHAARADLEAERHAVAARVVQLGFEVRTAIYDLQAAEQRLRVVREAQETFAASRDAAEALLAAGNISPLVAAAEAAAAERAQVLVAQRELEMVELRERVQRLLGISDASWQIVPWLPGLPETPALSERVAERAIRSSHDLAVLTRRLDAAARRTGLSRTEGWLPDITVDVHSLHGDPDDSSLEARDNPWSFGAGVQLSIPLFDRQQGTTLSAEAEFDGLSERYRGLALEIRSAARQVKSQVASAHAQVRRYRDVIVPAQRSVMDQTLLQYNAMQLGVFDLLRVRREQLDVELAAIDSLQTYWRADAALHALLEGSLVNSSSRSSTLPLMRANSPGEH